jgi:hypothetical protein
MAMGALPVAVILHLLIGIYAYGSPIFFSQSTAETLNFSYSYINLSSSSAGGTGQQIMARFAKTPWLTALLAIIVAYYAATTVLWAPLSWLLSKCCCSSENKVYS